MKRSGILFKLLFCAVVLSNQGLINAQCNLLCNMDFDNNQLASANVVIVDASQVPCWQTTATDNQIEIWGSGFGGVPAYSGNQFIELNAYMVSTIFQNFTVAPGTALVIGFAHRGRQGVDVLSVDIGPVGGSYTSLGTYSDGNASWGYYTVAYTVPMGFGNNYTLRFNSVSAAGGNPAVGNFLDAISVNLPYTVALTTSGTNASCGLANGTATVTANGGVSPYSYSWNSSPVQLTQTATSLAAGTYTVTVADSNGCVETSSLTLSTDPQPDVEVSNGLNPLCDSTKLNWASWASVNSNTGNGIISSDLSVTVTKPTGGLSTTGGMFNPGVFPTQYNVPVNNTAIRNDLAGLFTFCFNRPVVNPQIALSSIGNGGNSVQINTSVPYQVIWFGQGMSYPNNTTFVGTEGYTIIQFPGVHTCISFDYLQSETYCNLAFGTLDTNCQALAPPPMCAGLSDTLTATGAATYSWTPAAGLNTTTGAVVIATPSVTTTYYVTGSNGSGCSDTDSITITVEPPPIASVIGDTVICAGDSTTLTASGGVSYVWNPGNLTGPSPTLKPLVTTTYTVVATNAAGCNASGIVQVVVNPLPVVVVTPPSASVCIGSSQNLTAGGANTYAWSLPAGLNTTTGSAVTATPLLNTTYTVTGTDTQGCVDTATVSVIVNPKPTVNVAGTTPLCIGQSDTLTASAALTYSWTPAAGLNSTTGAVVVATPTVTTTYYVTGVDTNSCSNTDSITIVVNALPIVVITGDTVICAGDSTLLTASGGTNYLWKPLNIPNASITIRPLVNSVYTAVVTNAAGCIDSASVNVIVNPVPDAQFSVAPVCRNEPSVFMNTSTGTITSWVWTYDDGTGASIQSPSHTYATCDSFSVELLVTTVDGCVDSILNIARVYCLPVADFGLNDACMNEPVLFSDLTAISGGTITTWDWNFGDNSAAGSSQNPSHPYTTYGSFDIYLITTTNQGCMDTVSHSINIHPLPVPQFTANNVCAGSIVPFANQSTIPAPDMLQSWVWDFADGTPVYNNPNILHPYPNTGSYTVELTVVSDFGCADSLTQTIIVNPNPVVEFTATDTVSCAPLCLSFSDMSSITPPPAANAQWLWNLGDSSGTVTSLNFDHCYANLSALNTAYYSVSLTVTSDSGCVTTKTKNNYITVYPNPAALFVADPSETNIINPTIAITNQSVGATIWSWNYGDADTSSGPIPPSHTYADTGSYTITLITTNQHGCMDTAFQNVIVEPSFTFYIPNAFTPNNDGINDFFSGQGTFIKEYKMSIFDRWGNFIFYTDEMEKPWDGTANYGSVLALQDTYVYTIEITDFRKQKHRYNGIVTLVGGRAN